MDNSKLYYKLDLKRYTENPETYIRIWLYLYRKCCYCQKPILSLFYRASFRIWSNMRGLEISTVNPIGGGIYLGHAYNITINQNVRIGNNCNLHKGIVIGQENRGKRKGVPNIGNKVWIGINAAIVGKITIGDDVLIAPNSYVNCDVPSHSVVYGNPCIIKHRDWATERYINNIVEQEYMYNNK